MRRCRVDFDSPRAYIEEQKVLTSLEGEAVFRPVTFLAIIIAATGLALAEEPPLELTLSQAKDLLNSIQMNSQTHRLLRLSVKHAAI